MTSEETVHYQIYNGSNADEWESVFPPGGGFVHLGDPQQTFGVALFHQFHCLMLIRTAMNDGVITRHLHHCFTYLRQSILCDADATLEPVVMNAGRQEVYLGVPRACRDWSAVYKSVAQNHAQHRAELARNGSHEFA
ncbi:hypothetical protein CERSUDRAFT_104642 [Gelatoporia subvermispora B]|uniref:Uncharacterized protein n=1 Tax=Ceriporiopsis subvermispora (strain B) TaxID=914234 RepID=M2RHP4_CERS8|nr:hypothetical protein CERSUDRAFT_104642 [Gelatoporia subvermispora B]